MGNIAVGEIRPSMTLIYNNELYTVIDCTHVKVARGSASCRVKMKNLKTGQTLECTLRDSDNFDSAFIEKRKLQYSYHDGDFYHFLDLETYHDLVLNKNQIGDDVIWLKDHLELNGIFYDNELINLDFPLSLDLKIVETDPGFRGDTVKGGTKPTTLETGAIIHVPLFINSGETIKVDIRTKEYLGRA